MSGTLISGVVDLLLYEKLYIFYNTTMNLGRALYIYLGL